MEETKKKGSPDYDFVLLPFLADLVKYLVDPKGHWGIPKLHRCADNGDLAKQQKLLARGVPVDN